MHFAGASNRGGGGNELDLNNGGGNWTLQLRNGTDRRRFLPDPCCWTSAYGLLLFLGVICVIIFARLVLVPKY